MISKVTQKRNPKRNSWKKPWKKTILGMVLNRLVRSKEAVVNRHKFGHTMQVISCNDKLSELTVSSDQHLLWGIQVFSGIDNNNFEEETSSIFETSW